MKLDIPKINEVLNSVTEYNKSNALMCLKEFRQETEKYQDDIEKSNLYAIALGEVLKVLDKPFTNKDISMTGLQFLMVFVATKMKLKDSVRINDQINDLYKLCLEFLKDMNKN